RGAQAQRPLLHLLVEAQGAVARPGPGPRAPAAPDRRAVGAVPGASRALLAPRLLAAAGDLRARLRGMRAAAERREPGDDHLVHQRDVDRRLEELSGELLVAHLLARAVEDGCRRHQAPAPAGALTAERTITRPPFGPGTAPLSRRRFRSGSAWKTSRLRTVTRSFPIW